MEANIIVDAKGLACPMPIVRAKKALDQIESGQVMQVLSTDKGSVNDFQSWVKQTNNELLEHKEEQGVYTFYVRKK